jgi:hypothetical protein
MFRHILPLFLVTAVIGVAARPAFAEEKSHEGLVVSAAAGKLTMTMSDGSKKHSHEVGTDAKVTIDGKPAKLEDLKEGFHIKVTQDDKKMVTKIEASSMAKPKPKAHG